MTEDEMVDDITDPTDMSLSKLQERAKDREAWHALQRFGYDLATEQQKQQQQK